MESKDTKKQCSANHAAKQHEIKHHRMRFIDNPKKVGNMRTVTETDTASLINHASRGKPKIQPPIASVIPQTPSPQNRKHNRREACD
jgi:hypothetical protein